MPEPIVLPGKNGKPVTITASTRCPACGEPVLEDPQHLTVDYVGKGRKEKTYVRHSACPPPLPEPATVRHSECRPPSDDGPGVLLGFVDSRGSA